MGCALVGDRLAADDQFDAGCVGHSHWLDVGCAVDVDRLGGGLLGGWWVGGLARGDVASYRVAACVVVHLWARLSVLLVGHLYLY